LGGVAAGLSSYLGWDVTWLRIALVAIVLIGWGTIIPIYVVVWLIAPKAVTVAQRLEMQGEDVTVENIKSEINNVKNYVESEKFKQQASGFGEKFAEVFRTIFKVFAGFIGAIFGFVGIVLAIALVFVLISLFFIPGLLVGFSPELASDVSMLTGDNGAILIIALLLVVGTPIFMLIYWAINLFNRRKFEHAGTTSLVTLLIWLAGIFMLYSVGAKTIVKWTKSDMHYHFNWDEFDGPTVDQARTYEAFTAIEVSNNIEVEITNDSLSQLVINAPENILDKVTTEFADGRLKIYTEQFMINAPIKVRVSAQTLDYIEGSGASQIKTKSVLKSNNLMLKLSGASQAYLDFDVTGNTEVDLSGASKAELKGTSNYVKIDASGASKFEGESFLANDSEADASGASKIDVFARRSLNADASGASEINCTGNPEKVKRSENMGADIRVK
jgi:phage shock protein PspC (stress-responsive transcriptional regulator)